MRHARQLDSAKEHLRTLVALYERQYTDAVLCYVVGRGKLSNFRISIPARDAVDFLAEYQAMEERLGGERMTLLMEMNTMSRRLEWASLAVRGDLYFQPN